MSSPPPARTLRRRVPVEELVDLASLDARERPSPRRIRAALPRGWVLEPDGRHARRDLRLVFREGWILILGLVVFGSLGAAFLWGATPAGWRGVLRLALLVLLVLLAGGLVAPGITRALTRRRSGGNGSRRSPRP